MKKILIILLLVFAKTFLFGQTITTNTPGSVPRANKSIKDVEDFNLGARANLYIPRMKDTVQANESGNAPMDTCGRIIYTYLDNALWLRACSPKRWVKPSNISTFNFLTDSSLIICYNDGHCDTISILNLDNVVINIVNNFNDNSVYNLNDSTLVICSIVNFQMVCDTIDLGSTNNYYFLNDSTLVTCDVPQIICVPGVFIADSCSQQQICDTISVPPVQVALYQNGVRIIPGSRIREVGDNYGVGEGSRSNLFHNTELFTNYNQLKIYGRTLVAPPLSIQQQQWLFESPPVVSFNHKGDYPPSTNNVNLSLLYTTPFASHLPDTGFFRDRVGYFWGVNTPGARYALSYENASSKQAGILFHTLDATNTDGVTIFAQQVPAVYDFSTPHWNDSSLYDQRVAVFKTNQQQQNPQYTSLSSFPGNPQGVVGFDSVGNFITVSNAGTSTVRIITDTSIEVCNLNSCDTFFVNITDPTTINIFNDTTIIICNEAGSCDTITVNNYTITNGLVINIAKTLFVMKSGNDATGIRQRLDLPFLTIRSAERAAIAGDVIVVYPGDYEELDTCWTKNVNYHFIGKGEVRLVTTLNNGILFYDHGVAKTSVFDAPGWTFLARGNQVAFRHTDSTVVKIIADEITSETSPALDFYDGTSSVTANRIYTANSFATVYYIEEHGTIDADSIVAGINGSAIYFEDCPYFNVHAGKVLTSPTNGDYMIYGAATNPEDSVFLTIDLIRGGTEWPLYVVGDATQVYVNAKKITANSDCIVVSGTDQMTVNAQEIESTISTATDGIIHAEGGGLLVIGAKLKRNPLSTGYDLLASIGGTLTLNSVSYDQTRVNITGATSSVRRIDSLYYGSNFQFTNARLETDTAQIVAANDLTLGRGNVNLVSGATQITAITTAGWQAGSASVYLQFSGAPLVKNNTAGGAGTATIKLAGATDFQAAADDVLGLEFDGTYWHETSRKLASGTVVVAANNGTSLSGSTIQLGGTAIGLSPLLHDTYISTTGSYKLQVTGTNTSALAASLYAENSGNGTALYVSTYGGANADATTATLRVDGFFTSTNSVEPIMQIIRNSTVGANGIGGAIEFRNVTTTLGGNNSGSISNRISSKWVDATTATKKSQLDINGSNSNTILSAYDDGVVGIGISSSYTATRLDILNASSTATPTARINSSSTGQSLDVVNTSTGYAIQAASEDGYGVYGSSATSFGVLASSISSIGIYGTSTSNMAGSFLINPSSTNTIESAVQIIRRSSGTAANGIGFSFDLRNEVAEGNEEVSNQIISKWTNATNASRTSTLTLTGVLSTTTVDLLTLAGDGSIKLRPITATEASAITPAEGMIVMVSSTNGTFGTIGMYSYQNGAWHAL